MHITLGEREYETVMNALLNVQHDFNFIHGLRVTIFIMNFSSY